MFRGKSVKWHRHKAGLSKRKMAAKMGVCRRTIGRWESGDTIPRPKHLTALAELFGVRTRVFFD